jgi:hypothetical protein
MTLPALQRWTRSGRSRREAWRWVAAQVALPSWTCSPVRSRTVTRSAWQLLPPGNPPPPSLCLLLRASLIIACSRHAPQFVDVWTVFNATEGVQAFRRSEVQVYADVVQRIAALAESKFGVSTRLHLTAPTFFSRISGDKPPRTAHDEYWHTHVDLEQYGSFVITSLLYLADAGADFEGGQFEFMPPGTTHENGAGAPARHAVKPARGKLVLFSSGSEHPHRVTRVTSGTRLALTIAFTCDEGAAVADFLGRALEG